jgi:glycosyltransferase involved in cell wall biosynthesis
MDVPRLPRELFSEVYAVDAGSADGTVEYLETQGIPVYRQPKRSLNAAYAHAVEKCTGDAVVVFFPKGTIAPDCVASMVRLLDEGYDLVVASRNMPGARNEEDAHLLKPRKWGVGALGLTASILWRKDGWRIRDVLHGVKAFTVESYRRMNVSDTGVTVDLEMTVRAYRLRIPRIEFPVVETTLLCRKTKFKILPTAIRLVRFLWCEFFRSASQETVLRCSRPR